jgi:acyl-CoA dehydrogenase
MLLELDRALAGLQAEIAEQVPDLRARALAVDSRPQDMAAHLAARSVQTVHRLGMLDRTRLPGRCLRLAVGAAEAARGDAGVLLACPGPSVAGVVVDLLGDDSQRARFRAAVADGRTWAFCAITEPRGGSDVLGMRTELRPDGSGGYLLSGIKRYVGNASRGSIGVVFARTGPSPLAIRAVLVTAPAPGLIATAHEMLGLRGARIGELTLDEVAVPRGALLGERLPVTSRGMWGALRAFDSVRVQVAAMALGTAQAVHDYVRDALPAGARRGRDELASADEQLDALRQLVWRAAVEVDAQSDTSLPDGAQVQQSRSRNHLSSLVKLEAVELARTLSARLPDLLGPGALLEHPLLEKWRRDAIGFEFMEGTSSMQRLNIAEGYLRRASAGRVA